MHSYRHSAVLRFWRADAESLVCYDARSGNLFALEPFSSDIVQALVSHGGDPESLLVHMRRMGWDEDGLDEELSRVLDQLVSIELIERVGD